MSRFALALLFGASCVATAAQAQSEIVGEWRAASNEFDGDPDIGEYEGLPINEAARRAAHAWNASRWTVPERQCIPHPSDYAPMFSGVRISKSVDPLTQQVVAYHTNMAWMNATRTIWMDGRAHPGPNALHTWEGFSTGKWEGDVLVVTTTHMKVGYHRRVGTPRSTSGVLVEHFIRTGDTLTWNSTVYDPETLTEPYIKSRDFRLDPGYQITVYPCSTDTEIIRPEGEIPHNGLSLSADQFEYADKHGLPHEATEGGAPTAYPEYQQRIEQLTSSAARPAAR